MVSSYSDVHYMCLGVGMDRDQEELIQSVHRAFLENPSEENQEDYISFLMDTPPSLRKAALEYLLDELQTLYAENQRLGTPPLQLGVIWDPAFGNGSGPPLALVKTLPAGRPMVCRAPLALRDRLLAGSQVTLTQEGAILDVGQSHQGYQVGRITRYCADTCEVMVANAIGQDEETILLLADELRGHPVMRAGTRVRYDPDLRLVTHIEHDQENRAQTILDQLPAYLTWDHLIVSSSVREDILDVWDEILAAEAEGEPLRVLMTVAGPPGVGKTWFAKTLAVELSRRLSPEGLAWLFVKGTEPVTSLLGQSEANIRRYFAQVRENAAEGKLTFLVWDEIDATVPRRGTHSHLWPDTIVNTMLSELDGLEELRGVVLLALSNRPDLIDEALMRPNRLGGRVMHMTRPDWPATQQLFQVYLDLASSDTQSPVEELAEGAATYIWAPARIEEHPIAIVNFVDGTREAIPRTALISGDLVRGAVETANRSARRRQRQGGLGAITFDDVCAGIEQVYEGILLAPHNLAGYLSHWSLQKCARVESLTKPNGHS
jgi:hypothetical protein